MLEINLLAPAHTRRRVNPPPLRVSAIAVSLALILGVVMWSALLITRINRLSHDLATATEEIARLRPVARHVQELNRDAEQMRLRSAFLQRVLAQMPASQTLETIRSAIPGDVGLTSLTVAGGNVTVEGFAFSYSSLEHFMVALETSGGVRHVDLLSSQRGLVGPREVVKFRIAGDLVTPTVTSQKGTVP